MIAVFITKKREIQLEKIENIFIEILAFQVNLKE